MKDERAVISGSAVLALMEPNLIEPNDLDVYVPLGALKTMHTFLSQHTDYVKIPSTDNNFQGYREEYSEIETGTCSIVYEIIVRQI